MKKRNEFWGCKWRERDDRWVVLWLHLIPDSYDLAMDDQIALDRKLTTYSISNLFIL